MIKKLINKVLSFPPLNKIAEISLQNKIFNEAHKAFFLDQKKFPEGIIFPSKFGRGLPERVVELVFVKLSYSPGVEVLDVGHANAMICHRKLVSILPNPKHITGIDIAKPTYNTSSLYKKSYISSITKTPFNDESFDLIWCISSLEHFGMDNSTYTDNFFQENEMDKKAISEMIRILKTGGKLLITVPYGRYEEYGWFRNYDKKHWQELLDTVRPQSNIKELYFKHNKDGWLKCKPGELAQVSYFGQKNYGAAAIAICLITKKID